MKLSILLASVLAMVTFTAGAENVPARDVAIGVNDVYVPGGFDSDSDVFVIVSGVFPNSCYAWKEANIAEDKDANVMTVSPMATVSQGMCLMVLVPFQKEVTLGVLGSGNHTVRFMSGDGTYLEKTIIIE